MVWCDQFAVFIIIMNHTCFCLSLSPTAHHYPSSSAWCQSQHDDVYFLHQWEAQGICMPAVKLHCWITKTVWSVFYNSASGFCICIHIQCETETHRGAVCIKWSVTEKKKHILGLIVVFLVFEVVSAECIICTLGRVRLWMQNCHLVLQMTGSRLM